MKKSTLRQVPVITIDGPSGAGKGTITQLLAERLGWHYLDSGALYRALAYAAEKAGVGAEKVGRLVDLASNLRLEFRHGRVLLNAEDITDVIRTEEAGNAASKIAAIPEVREALLDWQRAFARPPGLVADGRDMGTVVFPDAPVKIYLTASPEERAKRRYKQLNEKGIDVNVLKLAEEIRERDERDRNRSVAPLNASAAALKVDSTGLSIEEVFEKILAKVKETFPDLKI